MSLVNHFIKKKLYLPTKPTLQSQLCVSVLYLFKMPGVLLEKPQASGGEEATPMEVKEAGSEEAQAAVKEPTKNDAPASRSTVGIIYPPPEVRSIHFFTY